MLESFFDLNLYGYLLIFSRIGAAFLVLPGFGEIYISPRVRLIFALLVSLIIFPTLQQALPIFPESVAKLFISIAQEIIIGLFMGLSARILFSALSAAGVMIAFQSGLANALIFDPNSQAQGAVLGAFLSVVGMTLLFVTNMHHVILKALIDSYSLFGLLAPLQIEDMSLSIVKLVSKSFEIAFKISLPFIIISLVTNTGMGILARLMPQFQVYFVLIPVQLTFSLFIFAIALSATFLFFWDSFSVEFSKLFLR